MGGRSLPRIYAGLVPFNIAAQAASFAAWVAFAHVLGTSTETDAYLLALSVPAIVYSILLTGVSSGAIPSLTQESADHETAEMTGANALISSALVASVVLTALVTVVTVSLAPFVLGSHGPLVYQTRLMMLELSPLGVFGATAGVLTALLAVRGRFKPAVVATSFDPLLRTGLVIACGHALGVQSLVLANLLGAAFTVAVLLWQVQRAGFRLALIRPAVTPFVRSVASVSLPLVISASVLQVNPLVDKTMAGDLGTGSVTVLELGWRLVPTGLLIALALSPLCATWAARAAQGGWPALEESVTRALSTATTLVMPIMVIGILLRRELVTLAYHGGAFSPHSAARTSTVLGFFLIALPAEAFSVIFSTLFLVQKRTRISMWFGFANVVLNVGLNFALRPVWGVAGIALSTSVTLVLLNVFQGVAAHRLWGRPVAYPPVRLLVSVGGALAVATPLAFAVLRGLPDADSRLQSLFVVSIVSAVGLGAYAAVFLASQRLVARVPPTLRPRYRT